MATARIFLPDYIELGAIGGPSWMTEIQTGKSGREKRTARWTQPVYRYRLGIATGFVGEAAAAVIKLFNDRRGQLDGFLFSDPADNNSRYEPSEAPTATDQQIGTGDGTTTAFQLVKRYDGGGTVLLRKITRLKDATVLAALNGTPTSAFNVNIDTGLITFSTPPGAGVIITTGYAFYVPVRFDEEVLEIKYSDFNGRLLVQIPPFSLQGLVE